MKKDNNCIDCDKKIDKRSKRCRICSNRLIAKSNIGFKYSKDVKKRMSLATIKSYQDYPNYKNKISQTMLLNGTTKGKNNPMFGKKDKLAPNYIHGKGYDPYTSEFTQKLKYQIRERDNFECQNCDMTEEEHLIVIGQILEVHHIDYNKKNCKRINLITLCCQCNIRVNYNRNYWTKYFERKVS